MQTIALLAAALALPFLGAFAAPSTERRETPGNVYVCTGADFSGTCEVISLGTTGCHPIPAPYAFNSISVGPDRGAICRLFDQAHPDCTGSGLAILTYPGNTDLGSADTDFAAHKAAYWYCRTCTNCQ